MLVLEVAELRGVAHPRNLSHWMNAMEYFQLQSMTKNSTRTSE